MTTRPTRQARRLKNLARTSATFEAFLTRAQRFRQFYGFPGQGSMRDYQDAYSQSKEESNAIPLAQSRRLNRA